VLDDASQRMSKRSLEYVPALYKIFDEILVNAADNLIRDPTQNIIRVEVKRKEGSLSVWNNGAGLPIQMHREHKCYVPELVFGHLLTSDNYDDSEKKVVGGRNGYGAKLTNIFSTKFMLETADSRSGKKYKQVWEKNMTVCHKPSIVQNKSEDYTQVTFFPDFARFGMRNLEEDIVALMRRRAFDLAASTQGRCQVFLDGQCLGVSSFQDYVDLHVKPEMFRTCKVVNDRWEIAIGLTDGSGFQQVSFVNSINTSRGGTHVTYIADQVVSAILDKIGKQKSGGTLAVKSQHVKSYLWIFVNCLIENPAFDSQTKETLTSKRERFGSACRLPEELLEDVVSSGIVEALQEWSKAMGKNELAQHLNRSDLGLQKRLFGVPKLEDANLAGTKEGESCTLILTEGDSAKALAVAGLGVVGRDRYGVFPLRGKLRNVRELTVKQMLENKEIEQVLKIMALDASKDEYRDAKGLRYGSIMIMTDQDHDGSHIKGLIINFIQHWFPSLLRLPGFLKEFVTPIVKVSRGDETLTFFTLPEYESWKRANGDGRGWKCKYYKGLGTSTSSEAKEYFADLGEHELQFTYSGSRDDDLIDMAFAAKRSDDRKVWISSVEEGTFVDHSQPTLSYSDFIEKELSLFAKYDVERAVPSLVDGLKPGQRKVLYGSFKKKLTNEIKVAQLSGYVAETSAYHHGEASLQGTIIAMAQTFVGSNNINLFEPRGQFGSRLQGGKDHAAARYIFTCLCKVTRCLFPAEDDAVLEYLSEEGHQIEPRFYCPVIPLALVNGADGIGTGWSTSIPNHNPRDVIANIRCLLRKEAMQPMAPWFRGFKGTVRSIEGSPGKYEALGVASQKGRVRLEITELPPRRWTQDYKDWLVEQLPKPGDERRASITELREYHSENSVHFVLSMTPDKLSEAERRGFEKVFHLRSNISTTNMWLFDVDGKIQKYDSPEDIVQAFFPVRYQIYERRKAYLVDKMERELAVLSNKLRFVELVVGDRLDVEKKRMADLCGKMRKLGLEHMCQIKGEGSVKVGTEEEAGPDGFKYLLSMKLWSLTENKVEELQRLHGQKDAALHELRGTSIEALWEADLQRLEHALDECDEKDRKEAEAAERLAAKNMSDESFLVNKQCVLVLGRNFTAKRVRTSEWKARRRGGGFSAKRLVSKAKKGKDDDADAEEDADDAEEPTEGALSAVFCCHDFDALLVFSEHGYVYMLQALDVPLVKKCSMQGAELKDFLPELQDHRITALVTVAHRCLRDQTDEFVVLVSKKGFAKKVSIDRFRGLRPGKGLPCMKLAADDELQWAHKATANSALVVATAEGGVLRVSLGQDWSLNTAKGPGRSVIRMWKKFQEDYIAASSISALTAAELANIRSKVAAKASAATRASVEGPTKAENEESEKEEAAEKEDAAEKEEAAADDSDEDGQDAEDVNGEKADGAQDEVMDVGQEQADPANSDPGPCVLLVTKCGLGARVPLSSKRIGLGRRGGVPKRVLRVADHDSVAAACVVSGKDIREPEKPMEALQLYLKDHGDSTEAIFKSLPQEDMMPYQKQQDEEKRKYEEALKAFRQEDCEEVLLGNTGGAVTRIKVSTVPIVTRLNRGRLLAKTKGSDRICVASLLSSIEDDQDETGKEPAKSTPSNSAASRSRRAAERAADSAGSSLRGEAAPSEAPAQKPEVPVLPVPLPVERTPRSKLTQSLAKRRRSSNMSSPRRSPQSAVPSSIRLLKPKLRVLKSPFYAKRVLPRVFMFDLNLRRFVLSNE